MSDIKVTCEFARNDGTAYWFTNTYTLITHIDDCDYDALTNDPSSFVTDDPQFAGMVCVNIF